MLSFSYHGLVDAFLRTRIGGWANLHVLNPVDTRLIPWSGGRLSTAAGTRFGANVVLLRTVGAKTQQPRDVPLLATPWDGKWILVASATGRQRSPAWYHNLRAHPQCDLLVPRRGLISCTAHEAYGAEREAAWRTANRQYSGYETYQTRTERRIPVVILTPIP